MDSTAGMIVEHTTDYFSLILNDYKIERSSLCGGGVCMDEGFA